MPVASAAMQQPEISLETIGPERAAEMLSLNTNNRRLRPELVSYYAGCIERGEWVANGETIKFTDAGILADGQHRLSAVIKAGFPIDTLVARNLPKEALDSLDTGKARKVSDLLLVEGYERTVFLASAINALHRYTGNDFSFGKHAAPSPNQALAILKEASELERSTKLATAISRATGFAPVGALAALHYLFYQVDPEPADEFYDRLESGAELARGDAALHLRNRLLKESMRPRPDRLKAPEVAHLTIVAFNHRRAGNEVEKLRARFSDPFPTILPRGVIERQKGGDHFRHHGTEPEERVTIWDRVRAVITSSEVPLGPSQVAAQLDPPALVPTVNACLWRDAEEGRIQRVGRGLYAALDYSGSRQVDAAPHH